MEELRVWLNAAGIDRGKIFRRVTKMGRVLGEGMTEKAGLAHREGFGKTDWIGEIGAARPAPHLRPPLPRCGRRVGTDPVPSGTCFHSDDRTLPGLQAADSVGSQ